MILRHEGRLEADDQLWELFLNKCLYYKLMHALERVLLESINYTAEEFPGFLEVQCFIVKHLLEYELKFTDNCILTIIELHIGRLHVGVSLLTSIEGHETRGFSELGGVCIYL